MAKRAPISEKPFNPLDESLVRAVMTPRSATAMETTEEGGGVKVLEPPSQAVNAPTAPGSTKVVPIPESRLSAPAKPEVRSPREDVSYIDRRDREKRVLLTRDEERELDRLVERLATELRTRVKLSHVLRACYLVLMHAEDEILERARRAPAMSRPGNGNAPELIAFERDIAAVLAAGFRESTPLRS